MWIQMSWPLIAFISTTGSPKSNGVLLWSFFVEIFALLHLFFSKNDFYSFDRYLHEQQTSRFLPFFLSVEHEVKRRQCATELNLFCQDFTSVIQSWIRWIFEALSLILSLSLSQTHKKLGYAPTLCQTSSNPSSKLFLNSKTWYKFSAVRFFFFIFFYLHFIWTLSNSQNKNHLILYNSLVTHNNLN